MLFLLILSDKVFTSCTVSIRWQRLATPVRHNGGRGFSNGRVPVTSKSSQFITPLQPVIWLGTIRYVVFQFLHDFIFQTNHSHSITSSIWIHLAPLPPFMLPSSPLLLPLRLELVFYYHGFGGRVYDGEIQDARPWGGKRGVFKKCQEITNTCWNHVTHLKKTIMT